MHFSSKRFFLTICLVFSTAAFAACHGAGDRQARMIEQIQTFMQADDYQQAGEMLKKALSLYPENAQTCFLAGQVELHANNTQRAHEWFNKAVQLDPGLLDARVALARLLVAAGRIDQAKTHIDFILERQPRHPEALVMNSTVLISRHQYARAEKILTDMISGGDSRAELFRLSALSKALRKDKDGAEKTLLEGIGKNPDDVGLRLALARLYTQAKQTDRAVAVMQQLMDMQPNNIAYPLALAKLYLDSDKADKAGALLAAYIDKDARNPDRRLALAQFYLNRKDNQAAEKTLSDGIALMPKSYTLRQGLSRLYLKTNRPENAEEVLRAYLDQKDGDTPENLRAARLALAGIYLNHRSPDQASRLVQHVLKEDTFQVEANYLQGRIYLLKGQGDSAAASFNTVISRKPEFLEAYLRLADAELLTKNDNAAVEALQKGLKIAPGSKPLNAALAKVQMARKDYKAAEAQLLEILKIDPGDYQVQAELGDFYLALKDSARAEREYAEIVNKYPANDTGYIRLARLYQSLDEADKATAILEDGYPRARYSKALAAELVAGYLSTEKSEKAVELCEARLKRNPDEAFAYNLLGRIRMQQKKYDLAEKALQKAVDIDPQWAQAGNNLAALYLVQGKNAQAIKKLESVLVQNPENPAGYVTLARLYEQDRNYQKAAGVYERGLEVLPKFWGAANGLAFLLCEHQRTEANLARALELATRAYRLNPGNAGILDTLGWIHYHQGDARQALAIFRQIARQLPDNEMVNYHLAMALLKSGRKEEARSKLELSLKGKDHFPGREDAQKTLNSLKSKG